MNTALAIHDAETYWADVDKACKTSHYFRFHVSGDILNKAYLEQMMEVARQNVHCEILCFTKRYELVNNWIDSHGMPPANLHLLFSGWDGLTPINPHHLPETNVILRGKQPDESWKLCGGNCFHCACRGVGCWQAKSGDVIAFHQH